MTRLIYEGVRYRVDEVEHSELRVTRIITGSSCIMRDDEAEGLRVLLRVSRDLFPKRGFPYRQHVDWMLAQEYGHILD